jgi:hypothetical protein
MRSEWRGHPCWWARHRTSAAMKLPRYNRSFSEVPCCTLKPPGFPTGGPVHSPRWPAQWKCSTRAHAARVLGPHTEGTIPGEAAVFAVLSRADHPAAARSTSVLLEGVSKARSFVPFIRADRVSGDALASAFGSFIDRGSQRVNRIVAAHSGEGYFDHSFSHAYLRSVDVMPEPLEVDLIADCVGDVGAAAGVVGLAFGSYRMASGVPGIGNRAIVYSESDTGEVGAALIAREG